MLISLGLFLHVLSNRIFVVVLDLAGNVYSCCVSWIIGFLQLGAITVNVNCALVGVFVSVALWCLLFT